MLPLGVPRPLPLLLWEIEALKNQGYSQSDIRAVGISYPAEIDGVRTTRAGAPHRDRAARTFCGFFATPGPNPR